ncbi:MAG: hypothetical protein HQ581_02620 [Planctomycetes bacterium]|nr:hypothetical protein [Planctomycetota bacterium]
MQPDEKPEDALYCIRDNTSVSGETPRCQHPSSYCESRDFCPVVEAERRRRRQAERDQGQ